MRVWIGRVIIGIGVLCLLGGAGLFGYNVYQARHAEKTSGEVLDVLMEKKQEQEQKQDAGAGDVLSDDSEILVTEVEEEPVDLHARFPKKDMPTIEVNGNAYIGTLEIPDLKLSLPVMEEWSYAKLTIAPCRFEGSAYRDDLVVCAHNYAAHFGGLINLEKGSQIVFTDNAGNVFTYEMLGSEELEPTAVDEMTTATEKDKWDLTLFTCNWTGSARNAFRFRRVGLK
ncbi:MAG: sortase [Eubacteriales bacterium]|nr:sortase [Eubacteriales bacterium]